MFRIGDNMSMSMSMSMNMNMNMNMSMNISWLGCPSLRPMSKGGGVPLGVPSDPKCPHNRVRSQTDATPRTHALTWSVTSRLESLFAPRCVQVGGRGPAEGAGGGSIGAFGSLLRCPTGPSRVFRSYRAGRLRAEEGRLSPQPQPD